MFINHRGKFMKTSQLILAYVMLPFASATFAQHSSQQQAVHHAPIQATVKTSPYVGEQTREIKSLSTNDISALQTGAGMGYAKAAELNGYPGPMHVLELAGPLKLSQAQRTASEMLLLQHKTRARLMGVQLIDAERALDAAFISKQIDASSIAALTASIGALQATLRAEHLQTHLLQTALLDPQQIASYQRLRGYDKTGTTPFYDHSR
jgi:Spy/CpxP family protein refolding chaperone